MLQAAQPDDYVLATSTAYSVRGFVSMAFENVGLEWQEFAEHDERYQRPTEVDALVGGPSKAAQQLEYQPRILTPGLVRIMVDADLWMLDDGTIRTARTTGRVPWNEYD